jgi:hypothetical protein
MSVTLEVSKLSGWLKADAACRVDGRACDAGGGEVRAGRREGLGWWRHTSGMHGNGLTQGLGAKGTREAHDEHAVHGRDAGGVEAQRLVEGRRGLPRVEGRACDAGGRGASPEAGGPVGWWRHTRGIHGDGPTQGLGAKGTRGERTLNMLSMVVTLEVSKLSGWLKAVADCRVEGKACDAGVRGASWEARGPGG